MIPSFRLIYRFDRILAAILDFKCIILEQEKNHLVYQYVHQKYPQMMLLYIYTLIFHCPYLSCKFKNIFHPPHKYFVNKCNSLPFTGLFSKKRSDVVTAEVPSP